MVLKPTCGICFEEFQLVHSPINASNIHKAASSTQLPFGISMPCPAAHTYCQACLGQYVKSKIDPSCDGTGSPDAIVFPLRCPECPIEIWEEGISESVAARVLSEEDMVTWVSISYHPKTLDLNDFQHHQQLLDSIPRMYCPNKKCSTLVQIHEDQTFSQAQCPACATMMCVTCRVLWHEGK